MASIEYIRYEEAWQGVTFLARMKDTDQRGDDTKDGFFRWVQTVITNDPLNGDPPEKVDQKKTNPPRTDPFYNQTSANTKEDEFEDICHRDLPEAGKTLQWKATLTLCAVNFAEKLLVVHDIRTWGFTMTRLSPDSTVGSVTVLPLSTDWNALSKHKDIVLATHKSWHFSPKRFERVRKLF